MCKSCGKAGFLPVELQFRIERINFAARLFGKAPEELRRLAAAFENCNDTNTWYGLLLQDLVHAQRLRDSFIA